MAHNRLAFYEWIVELGYDPRLGIAQHASCDETTNQDIIRAVNAVLTSLPEDEAELIRQHYFHGRSLSYIAGETGRDHHRVQAHHRHIIKKLRSLLAPFINQRFYPPKNLWPACPLCCHPRRDDIDRILRLKSPSQTWRPILRLLRRRFNLEIASPQRLIGHLKYHNVGTAKGERTDGTH